MKICTRCKNPKPNEAFAKRSRASDGLASWCKACFAENAKNKYSSDPLERERKTQNRKNQRDRAQKYILEYLETHPCVDCGTTDVRVLEFDHVRDVKAFNVSAAHATYSWERLLAEIEKCDVRCANCHRIKTAKQLGTWRSLLGNRI